MMGDRFEIRLTGDGSHTLFYADAGETCHSGHGAINESTHVFINAGLKFLASTVHNIRIMEVGLGTGLNLLLTYVEAQKSDLNIEYIALEPFPVPAEVSESLNFPCLLQASRALDCFSLIHHSKWEELIYVNDGFKFRKIKTSLQEYQGHEGPFSLIYYDAFSPASAPEMWTPVIFRKLEGMMAPNGVLVTYSAKGQVRRDLQAAGFTVERLPGPVGKREMLRAIISR